MTVTPVPQLRPLPLGASDFEVSRLEGDIHVDKTARMFELAHRRAKIFLTRPRRFGKSMLVSAFQSLFANGLGDFQGLAIEKLWTDKTYRTVRLDFSEIQDFLDTAEFERLLGDFLALRFAAAGFEPRAQGGAVLEELSLWMARQPVKSLVVLIDEYDAPLSACLDDPERFARVRVLLGRFYSTLKSNDRCLRFLFVTGITKFAGFATASEFNHLEDISLNPDYADLLGFTGEDIEEHFGAYLDRACDVLHLGKEEILSRLRLNYGGFCFDKKGSVRVFCPGSVVDFLHAPAMGFENYWLRTSGRPAVLRKHLSMHPLERPEDFASGIDMSAGVLTASVERPESDTARMLLATGYLTIGSVAGSGTARLVCPNREVAMSLEALAGSVGSTIAPA